MASAAVAASPVAAASPLFAAPVVAATPLQSSRDSFFRGCCTHSNGNDLTDTFLFCLSIDNNVTDTTFLQPQ
jgi:hypothetical protein